MTTETYKPMRPDFEARFGAAAADAVERAGMAHKDGILRGQDIGSDPFRHALLLCISFECLSRPDFASHHEIPVPFDEVDAWMRDPAQQARFAVHDGGFCLLTLACGHFDPYMPKKEGARA